MKSQCKDIKMEREEVEKEVGKDTTTKSIERYK